MSILIPTCPTDCTTLLPEMQFNYCAPTIIYGEIDRLFIALATADPFIDVESDVEWTARLSNTSNDANAIRYMDVIASKPAPEYTEIDISLDRKISPYKSHTIEFKVDDITELNYEFMRQLECGGTFKFWYKTSDGKLFGGTDGIDVQIKADLVIPDTNEQISNIEGTVSWRAKFSPEMHDYPL